jgi:hypothetical protein
MRSEEVVDKAINMFISNVEAGTCVDEEVQDKVRNSLAVEIIVGCKSVVCQAIERCSPIFGYF